MKTVPHDLLALARERHGLVTAAELTRFGIVGRPRSQLLSAGFLVPLHRGVYRIASHADSFEQRCLAACLAAPDAAISGPSAGRLWGLRKVHTDDVHLIARRTVKLERVSVHRTGLLGPFDVTERFGIRVLRPIRLLCDLAAHLDEAALESVIEQLLDRRLASIPSVRAAAGRFRARGRPGSLRLGRVLESRPAWLKPADSDLEVRIWRALAERGVRLDRQVPVLLDEGTTVHLDLGDSESRFAVEVDHVTWHGGRLDAQRDKRRDRMLARLGWTVVRVTDEDVGQRFAATVDEVVAIACRLTERS
jgi:very-short-patch-repair endonuclease